MVVTGSITSETSSYHFPRECNLVVEILNLFVENVHHQLFKSIMLRRLKAGHIQYWHR